METIQIIKKAIRIYAAIESIQSIDVYVQTYTQLSSIEEQLTAIQNATKSLPCCHCLNKAITVCFDSNARSFILEEEDTFTYTINIDLDYDLAIECASKNGRHGDGMVFETVKAAMYEIAEHDLKELEKLIKLCEYELAGALQQLQMECKRITGNRLSLSPIEWGEMISSYDGII
ncbi:MAG: hypothetical protein KatS3mg031_2838 [Chitinophagales bacterium]|nr:MAG: hypothetical protein KatS3mg031_2838 [Chitinophagales bacterium]